MKKRWSTESHKKEPIWNFKLAVWTVFNIVEEMKASVSSSCLSKISVVRPKDTQHTHDFLPSAVKSPLNL